MKLNHQKIVQNIFTVRSAACERCQSGRATFVHLYVVLIRAQDNQLPSLYTLVFFYDLLLLPVALVWVHNYYLVTEKATREHIKSQQYSNRSKNVHYTGDMSVHVTIYYATHVNIFVFTTAAAVVDQRLRTL